MEEQKEQEHRRNRGSDSIGGTEGATASEEQKVRQHRRNRRCKSIGGTEGERASEIQKERKNGNIQTEPVFVNLIKSPGIDSQPGGIDSLESIPGLHKRLKIRAQYSRWRKKQTGTDGYSRYRHIGRHRYREQEVARGTEIDGMTSTVLEFQNNLGWFGTE